MIFGKPSTASYGSSERMRRSGTCRGRKRLVHYLPDSPLPFPATSLLSPLFIFQYPPASVGRINPARARLSCHAYNTIDGCHGETSACRAVAELTPGRRRMYFDRWSCIIFFPIIVLVILLLCIDPGIKRIALTRRRLARTELRIREYEKTHQRLPDRLSDLPRLANQDNSIEDAWGRNIIYTPDLPGAVTLSSLGKDGRPGGTGPEDDDIRVFFGINGPNDE